MDIQIKRIAKKPTYTISKWYINGQYFCDGIEDTDRGLSDDMPLSDIRRIKVAGKTAIPTGKYQVTLKIKSPKYSQKGFYMGFCGGYMPRLLKVKGFEGILIHSGNSERDTEGCLICGQNKVVGKVVNSLETWKKLYQMMKEADDKNEMITVTIK